MTYWAFLSELLLAECDDRDERRRAPAESATPRSKGHRLADFDDSAKRQRETGVINALAGSGWVSAGSSRNETR